MKIVTAIAALLLAWVITTSAQTVAAAEPVTIGYQTGIDPAKVPLADREYEKVTRTSIAWKKFESGSEVITAMASGAVQIGNIGSSPLAAAASRGLPIRVFFVASRLGASEALVARNGSGISSPQDLLGKRVAVPFVSTCHYSLLAALKHWSLDPRKITLINLRPSEIAAAWQRRDIDAAYVWNPALGSIKRSGKVLATSADVSEWGFPTYDVWIVRNDFAQAHPEFVTHFAKVTALANERYTRGPASFLAQAGNIEKIARISGANPQDVPTLLDGNAYPTLRDQVPLLQGPFVIATKKTAEFLKSQGKIDTLLPDYAPFVTSRFVSAALQ